MSDYALGTLHITGSLGLALSHKIFSRMDAIMLMEQIFKTLNPVLMLKGICGSYILYPQKINADYAICIVLSIVSFKRGNTRGPKELVRQ